MAEVSVSPEASKVMELLPASVRAEAHFMLALVQADSESAVKVESIVYDAAARHVDMAVRITPALTNVQFSLVIA